MRCWREGRLVVGLLTVAVWVGVRTHVPTTAASSASTPEAAAAGAAVVVKVVVVT